MKLKMIVIVTMGLIADCYSQHTISATITGIQDYATVNLYDQDSQQLLDSTFVHGNSFVLKNNTTSSYPRNINMVFIENGEPSSYHLFIADENVQITGDKKDMPYGLKVSGSASQDQQNFLDQQLKALETERTEMVNIWNNEEISSNPEYLNKIKASKVRTMEIDKEVGSIRKKFINENPNSFVALNLLRNLKEDFSKQQLAGLYDKLDETHKKSQDANTLLNYIEMGDVVKQGDFFSDFAAKDQYGNDHKLSDYKGKFIVLDFTKEFCAPCEAAIKELKKLNAKYQNKLQIISFTGEQSQDYWKKGIDRNRIEWLCLWDGSGNSGKTVMKYGVRGFPNFFLINQDGKIVKSIIGYSKGILAPEVAKLIGE